MKTFVFTAALLLVAGTSLGGPKDVIAVVVNKANPATRLSRDELRPIFQTVRSQWPDGSHITAYDLPEGDAARDEFNAAVLGLDPERVARYWVDRRIRGGERPPVRLPTAGAVLHAVASNKGGIGFVNATEVSDEVKVVAKIQGGQVYAP